MALEAAGRPPEETLSLWKREQARLKARVVNRDTEAWQRDPAFSGLQRVGGVDVSFVKGDSVRACASLVVLSFPELEVVYEESRMVSLTAPYVSGFLAFREVPFLLELVQQLREKEPGLMPQVLLVDGNGVLHHRDPTPADSRRLVPSAGRLWDCPGNGPEESRPQHQAPLRLRGPQDEPGGSCAPDLLLLQVPDPRARAPGSPPDSVPESPGRAQTGLVLVCSLPGSAPGRLGGPMVTGTAALLVARSRLSCQARLGRSRGR
ncbi:endonuclease V isoform X5 [Pongo abelii]|uniref:endonuclease V isoform X5 n=1 Tax=Pongo abelii TaxID=9601 RepID=UPI003005B8D9